MNATQKKILTLILGLAFGLRLALCLTHPFNFPDSLDYDTLAKNLLLTHTYQVNTLLATRMPGYPLLVTAIYALTNYSQLAVLLFQSLLGTLSILILHRIAGRISQNLALIAAFLAAIDPLSLGFTASLLSETAFTFTLLLALWWSLLILESYRPHFRLWIWLGLTWAAAVYLRPSALWCILPIIFLLLYTKPPADRLRLYLGSILTLLLVLLALLPWQARNFSYFHSRFFRLTTLEGISLYEAVYPEADGSPRQDIIPLPPEMIPMDEAQRNDEWSRLAWHDIADDPLRILKLALTKIARTWSPTLNAAGFQSPPLRYALLLWHIPLFILALLGACTPLISAKLKLLLLAPIAYFTLVHSLFLGSVRYRVPLMPLVCIFAAAGIYFVAQHLKKPKPPALSPV